MSAAPSIIRRVKLAHEHTTHIPNAWLRDPRLSYKARGLLAVLLSHADGFEISIAALADGTVKEGREAIMSGLKELRGAGYLDMRKSRDRLGTFRTEYVLTEPAEPLPLPVDNARAAVSANPTRRRTRSANPTATRSANPTSIENLTREDLETQRNPGSAAAAPVDNFEPCPINSGAAHPRPHRPTRWGSCADCGTAVAA